MNNPWGVKLRETGLNEMRLSKEQSRIANIEDSQSALKNIASENTAKKGEYNERQASLAADAMAGLQGRLPGQRGGSRSRKNKKRKSHKKRTHRRRR